MDPRPSLPAGDYWYLGSPDPAIDQLFGGRAALRGHTPSIAQSIYHNDPDFAYDLMDAAVQNAERYYARFDGKRTALQLSYRITSASSSGCQSNEPAEVKWRSARSPNWSSSREALRPNPMSSRTRSSVRFLTG